MMWSLNKQSCVSHFLVCRVRMMLSFLTVPSGSFLRIRSNHVKHVKTPWGEGLLSIPPAPSSVTEWMILWTWFKYYGLLKSKGVFCFHCVNSEPLKTEKLKNKSTELCVLQVEGCGGQTCIIAYGPWKINMYFIFPVVSNPGDLFSFHKWLCKTFTLFGHGKKQVCN